MPDARSETLRDLAHYVLKVWLAGLAAALFLPLSVGAGVLDLVAGRGRADGLLGRVLGASAEMEAALDLHGHRTDIRLTSDPDSHGEATVATAAPRPEIAARAEPARA